MDAVTLTAEEWARIHRDYKATLADGTRAAFAGALPDGRTTRTGTTLVPVLVLDPPPVRRERVRRLAGR